MNIQKPEPRAKGDGSTLDFHSMFFTLQGEGPYSGHRAIFVRLAGCNLQCPGCDTEYTEGRKELTAFSLGWEVLYLARENGIGDLADVLVVITGGEPLRQKIGDFVGGLLARGFRKIQIESNGVFAPDEVLERCLTRYSTNVKLIVSPKTKRVHERTAELAFAFKYVLDHRSVSEDDGLPILALEHPAAGGVARPPLMNTPPIYVNPFDAGDVEENKKNLAAVAQTCMKFGYIAGIQLHKLLDLA